MTTDRATLEKRLEKILALASNNPNPGEAATAAAMAQRHITRLRLLAALETDRTQGDLRESGEADKAGDLDPRITWRWIARMKRVADWKKLLNADIAYANHCYAFCDDGVGLVAVGLPEDLVACQKLFDRLVPAIQAESRVALTKKKTTTTKKKKKKRARTGYRKCFQIACVNAVGERLKRSAAQSLRIFRAEHKTMGNDSRAIARVERALTGIKDRSAQARAYAERCFHLEWDSCDWSEFPGATRSGTKAGKKLSF